MALIPGRLSWQEIALTQAGVITIRDAVAAGLPRTEIRARLTENRWRQPYRGVLVTDLAPPADPQRLWAALQAIGPDAVLAGGCAAALAGLAGHPTEPITVLVPAPRRVNAPPGIQVRHSARLDTTEIDALRLPRCTTPSRSVVDMAEWAPTRAQARRSVVDAVLQGVVSLGGLRAALARRGPISRRTLIAETLDVLESDAPRLTEIRLRRLEELHDLPAAHCSVDGPAGEPASRLRVCFEPWPVRAQIATTVTEPLTRCGPGDELVVLLPARLLRQAPDEAATLLTGALRERGWVPPRRDAPAAIAS
ncbi:type IV toxin-antitoxin system AbiEi family antitoxin domain-containing protein [Frankia sp. AgKG'84/4]|uniref:type IV toxin-antitoxin system AbiEi family antitoxin domain-containing protein n=1 Tax=Frankia sp. AgKG'84/4 TaxID=573490 RepID=UPI00200C36C6|nr:type IV toxin-antitoxin system AbiEi family antitoxin domain-containing protein [Frankia sp. AgKG'84/4]MCL9798207.1 type IV toxin-antitoxin system AbiEi family antitoxin domain-containing protein [Frankia sp. AgKG'84/4]